MAKEVAVEPSENRVDLRHLEIMTIDGDRARDFDDALSVVENPDGTFQI